MREVFLIAVGKLKEKSYLDIEAEFLKRLTNIKLEISEVKEESQVPQKIKELSKNQKSYVITLAEKGKLMNGIEFSAWWYKILEERKEKIMLVLGGASGHDPQTQEMASESLSLSPLTFAHKMARLLLVEQLYRAQTIKQNHPYHK